MAALIIYARVSTSLQTDNTSLDYQVSRCKAYCEAYGHQVVDVIRETFSGKTIDDRKQVSKVIDQIMDDKADGIICLRLDRLSRDVRDVIDLAEKFNSSHKTLVFVENQVDTTTPGGMMVLTVLAACGKMEREMIQERSNAGRAAKKAAGGRIGGKAPYGYELNDGVLVKNEYEQTNILVMKMMRSNGDSYGLIADKMNWASVPTKWCGKWHPTSVSNILTAAH